MEEIDFILDSTKELILAFFNWLQNDLLLHISPVLLLRSAAMPCKKAKI